MLDEKHRRAERADEIFELHTGIHVDVVERFVPDIQVRPLAEASGKENLFLLAAEKSRMSFSNITRSKSSFRKIALNRLSSSRCSRA